MAPPTADCRKCAKPAELKCGRCRKVFYCCKEHQKEDWPLHKTSCEDENANFEIKESAELGYYVVATRDLKMNDVIVSELPLAMGCSNRRRQRGFCIGCSLQDIYFPESSKNMGATCPGCDWFTCQEGCPGLTDPARHANECHIIKRGAQTSGHVTLFCEILPIRCMLVQRSNPKMWKIMKKMGKRALKERDHKLFDSMMAYVPKIAFDIIVKKVSPYVEDASKETLDKINAFLDMHAIWMTEPADDYLVAIYPTASLLQQSCLPNSALSFQPQPKISGYAGKPFLGRVSIRATKDIKKGEILTMMHDLGGLLVMMSTSTRLKELIEVRGLRCKCARCLDPTELGLHTGTMKCFKCSGWVLPVKTTAIEESHWKCHGVCGRILKAERAQDLLEKIQDEISSVRDGEDSLNKIIKKVEGFLHPKHQECLLLKIKLAAVYGEKFTKYVFDPDLRGFDAVELKEVEVMCKDILSSLEFIGPVTSFVAKYYAMCLLQATRIEIEFLKRKLSAGDLSLENASRSVEECSAKLGRVVAIMNNNATSKYVTQAATDNRTLMAWAKQNKLN